MKLSAEHKYLEKHANFPALINSEAASDLALVVVIPSFNEKNLKATLDSLADCKTTGFSTEVIVVINHAEDASEVVIAQNQSTWEMAQQWRSTSSKFDLHTLYIKDIPTKKAGVGYARKTGMDEAIRRFCQSASQQKILVCLDADTLVQENYLQSIHDYFVAHAKCPAASIDYAHPTETADSVRNKAIAQYELHLRYYVLAKRWAGLEYAHQTVGSAMAVRSDAYTKQGGMNTRKAGEDFYFIHKFTHDIAFGNLSDTTVIPSARVSDRVPFGTGRAMQALMETEDDLTTYAPQSFAAIRKLVAQIPLIYEAKEEMKNAEAMTYFLGNYQFPKKLAEIRDNTSDYASFRKRFFQWFDAFMCMKFLHFSRDQHHPNIPIAEAANWLNKTYLEGSEKLGELELLLKFRAESKVYR